MLNLAQIAFGRAGPKFVKCSAELGPMFEGQKFTEAIDINTVKSIVQNLGIEISMHFSMVDPNCKSSAVFVCLT